MMRYREIWFSVFVACFLFRLGRGAEIPRVPRTQQSSEAYATLLYGDEFLLGVRVLGKSLRDTGTTKDLVVLVSDGVSSFAVSLLQADGWIVEHIGLLANPNHQRPTRFWGVYTKLKIFNMTSYQKVVYLDADVIVLRSIEDLFQCQKFCANLKHSERLNSGVMVVEPSEIVFKDMMNKVTLLPSYTGGDQGFLNSYFPDFPNAHLFEPNLSPDQLKSRTEPSMERLSTLYNADVGLYVLANKWMVDEAEIRVVHYTLGPLKPWDWWTAWLLKPVDLWQDIRVRLEGSLPGTEGGKDPRHQLYVIILFSLPILLALFYARHSLSQISKSICFSCGFSGFIRHLILKYKSAAASVCSSIGASTSVNSNQQYASNFKIPPCLGPISIVACFLSAVVSVSIAALLIPRQVMPWTGILLAYEWTFFLFMVLFGKYLDLTRAWGRASSNGFSEGSHNLSEYDSGKGAS
eukprot:TRINITY_DN9006_c0_g1_i1.p1 TRINITY_DN9006_c0_g1~~TRINITY_DN9006_c0_g1_i1.p1  ORF type:complete len:463 (-),score=63.06 TRINITY_DN9006_c0_g1_i1:37-1425(-)